MVERRRVFFTFGFFHIISIETNAERIEHGDFSMSSFDMGGLYNQLVVIENSTAFY